MSEERQNQNNMILNTGIYQEQQNAQNDISEMLLKTSSRPQRQAAKKAENQIRVNKYKFTILMNRYWIYNINY